MDLASPAVSGTSVYANGLIVWNWLTSIMEARQSPKTPRHISAKINVVIWQNIATFKNVYQLQIEMIFLRS